jgi:tetratricopeptide (TPR) repeat protein
MRFITITFGCLVLSRGLCLAGELPIPPAAPLAPTGNAQVARACSSSDSDQADEAVNLLRPLVDLSPLDMQARACFARALARTGDHEEARRQVSVALSWNSAWVEGYVLRAASAAEMGSVSRAMEDLELARILDPEGRIKQLVPATERIERRLTEQAEETATKPRASLLEAAHTDIGLEQLARLATGLLVLPTGNAAWATRHTPTVVAHSNGRALLTRTIRIEARRSDTSCSTRSMFPENRSNPPAMWFEIASKKRP